MKPEFELNDIGAAVELCSSQNAQVEAEVMAYQTGLEWLVVQGVKVALFSAGVVYTLHLLQGGVR